MPNTDSFNEHNQNYVLDDAFEKEKKAHQEHNADNFKFLYQSDIPHGDALDEHKLTVGVDIGSGTGWFFRLWFWFWFWLWFWSWFRCWFW